ncbi:MULTISPECIES: PbsX family transcriptional regulator [unclassified Rhizobium]|uniref:AbrB/MazE/SpoVT family DNA-binding domain-containing protein n=1 Tax=unclassified Rhizobium TaxID=2613769 RepID=UPI000DD5980D|nr:PbsX family transcriptional regulator [Rhizobium sp. BG4]QRM42467.1 PbsX family transcriptional regulator [Rhizobium sp. BG4]
MSITTKIRRQGGAAIVTLPPAVLKMMQVEVGDQLSLDVANGELIGRATRPAKKRYSLSELLEGADEIRALNAEVADAQDGDPVGREI